MVRFTFFFGLKIDISFKSKAKNKLNSQFSMKEGWRGEYTVGIIDLLQRLLCGRYIMLCFKAQSFTEKQNAGICHRREYSFHLKNVKWASKEGKSF